MRLNFCIIFAFVFFASLSAHSAVTAPTIPGSADVGRVKQRIESEKVTPALQNKVVGVPDASALLLPIPEGADRILFTLRSVRVVGSSVFDTPTLLGDMQKRVGSKVTLAEIYRLGNNITQRYWDAGYAFTRVVIPEQKIQSGEITIRVLEGYLYDIKNVGVVPVSSARDALFALTKQRPLKRSFLDDTVLRVNNLAGKKITATLVQNHDASKQEAFALRMETESVSTAPSYVVGINNFGSRYNGPFSTSISATIPDWLIPYGTTSITASTSLPLYKQQYLGVSQAIPLAAGTSFTVGGSVSHSEPGYLLKPQDMEGTSYGLNLALSHDILRSRNENLIANVGFDYTNGENDILSTQFYDDRLRVLGAGAEWDNSDSLGGSNTANIGIRQGLDILNASRKGSLLLSRAEGESDFTTFRADASREQQLGSGFLGIISTSGQYAPQPLLSAEEFGYGGQQFGRGYDSSELTGDSGIAASLELRYYGVPSPVENLNLVPYSFFDIGKVWNRDTGGDHVPGASTGLGLMAGYEDIYGNFSVALPLRHDAATPPSYANGNSPRFLFSLQKSF